MDAQAYADTEKTRRPGRVESVGVRAHVTKIQIRGRDCYASCIAGFRCLTAKIRGGRGPMEARRLESARFSSGADASRLSIAVRSAPRHFESALLGCIECLARNTSRLDFLELNCARILLKLRARLSEATRETGYR